MSSMEVQPVQTPLLLQSGGGGRSGTKGTSEEKGGTVRMEETEEKNEGSPSIKLGLGIDATTPGKAVMKQGKCVFTTAQLHELQLQALIFKYMAGGIPVPVNLVMPIWKSVASSFGSARGGIYERYPSFLGVSPQGFDDRNMIDPEPGRCGRTDGKKWRCSKNVIPNQKYCEQHMHRGRRRSRKPVEPSEITLPDTTLLKNSNKAWKNSKNLVSSQYINPSSWNTSTSHETASVDGNNVCNNRNSISTSAASSSTIITSTNNDDNKNNCKRNKISPNTSEKAAEKFSVSNNNIIIRSSKSGTKATVGNSIFPVLGCSSSRVYNNEIELEPGRCRRTDGKRWRCSRDVIPDQKYCARHMHRGARKHVDVSQPVAIPTIGDCPPNRLTIANKAACAALSTGLSISIPSPQPFTQEQQNVSSSSETTISDPTVTVFENGNFS